MDDRENQHSDERITKALSEALRDIFDDKKSTGRFIDVSRIPLICKSIFDIHANIGEIKGMIKEQDKKFVNVDQFMPVKQIVTGLVGLILVGVVGALLSLIFAK